MRVLFLGFSVSDELFQRVLDTDRGMPVQTQRFGWAVVEALGANGVEVEVAAVEPIADFPHNSRIAVRGHMFSRGSVRGTSLGFINVTGLKHVTRYVSLLRLARTAQVPDAIVVHGVHSPFLWAAVKLGRRWKVPVVPILTDAPSQRTRYDNWLTLSMKQIDQHLILQALARVSGVIALTPTLADELASGLPSMVMEGIAPDIDTGQVRDAPGAVNVVYAGSLHETYGVLDLVASVDRATEDWQLLIYGRGPAEEQIIEAALLNRRISYGGSFPPDAVGDVYAHADVLVNPRDPAVGIAMTSFPSKLLEYMSSGVPVVSTALPALPPDYREHLEIAIPGPDGLAQAIDRLARLLPEDRRRRGTEARRFIMESRGKTVQGRAMKAFILGLPSVG